MANVNNPHGFASLGTNVNGGPPVIQELLKAVGDSQAIFKNDPVARVSGGAVSAGSITPGTTLFSGVAIDYGAASTATTHKVIVDPSALFEAQCVSTLAASNMGKNANVTYTQAGSATTKVSGAQIDDSTVATTSTLDLHLIQLYSCITNLFGANARVEVIFNKQRFGGGVAGV